jgi:hypothetical protein
MCLLGHEKQEGIKGYKLYDRPFHKVIFGQNVIFDEKSLLKG